MWRCGPGTASKHDLTGTGIKFCVCLPANAARGKRQDASVNMEIKPKFSHWGIVRYIQCSNCELGIAIHHQVFLKMAFRNELHDPFLKEYESACDLLKTSEWRTGLDQLERLSHQGSIMSILFVADALRDGWKYDQDFSAAEAWYLVAIDFGATRGLLGLGLTYLLMGRFDEALQNLEKAAECNYAPAHNALAGMYFRGDGVPVDKKRALELWKKAVSLGHLPAQRHIIQQSIHGHYGFFARLKGYLNLFPVAWEITETKTKNPYNDRFR